MDIATRSARADDHASYARLHLELGVPDGPMTPEQWHGVLDRALVVVEGGQVVAYGLWMIYGAAAHVMNVVVNPSRRGAGLGARVMSAIAARVREAGATEWFLNVKETNATAIRLYERFGLRHASRSSALSVRWADVERLPEGTALIRPLQPHEDAGVEAHFGLTTGLLAGRRASPLQYSLLVAAESGQVTGIAVASPARPGAYPFRATRLELARPLLEAIRPLLPPDAGPMTIVVEDNEPLTELLIRAGAQTNFVMHRMTGTVP